jgi:hypothetical protein
VADPSGVLLALRRGDVRAHARGKAVFLVRRVIFTFATGAQKYKVMAKALALSLELVDSKTRRVLMTDSPEDPDFQRLYHEFVEPTEKYPHWFSKLALLELTDADQVMFIDGDCLAVKNVDELFDKLQGSEFAVQGEWIDEPNWYGDFATCRKRLGLNKTPTFSGGWLYYERTERTQELIREIMSIAAQYDELGIHRNNGKIVDEVCISLAMAKTGIGKVFPNSSNFSVTTWYKMKRCHLDVLKGECTFIEAKYKPIICKPYIYHSAMADWDVRYWFQMRRLFRLFDRFPGWPRKKDGFGIRLYRQVLRRLIAVHNALTGMNRR